jgi:hypothetical protein
MGWTVRGSNSGWGEIFRTCPDLRRVPPSLLHNGHQVFPGGRKRPGRDADPSLPSSAEVQKLNRVITLLSLRACKKGEKSYIYTYVHTYTYMHAYTCKYIHPHTHTHSLHTYVHTYTHARALTHMQPEACKPHVSCDRALSCPLRYFKRESVKPFPWQS